MLKAGLIHTGAQMISLARLRPLTYLICTIVSGCGGGASSGGSTSGGSGNNINLGDIESNLNITTTLDGQSPNGVWLLAQERSFSYTSNNAGTSFSDTGTTQLTRTDILTLEEDGSLLKLYYCADRSKLAFEASTINNSQFELTGDGYYFPSKELYTGIFVGDGTVIQFSPSSFSSENASGGTTTSSQGSAVIKAYKLRDGFDSSSIGLWQKDQLSESIRCGTYSESESSGIQIDSGTSTEYSTSKKQLSLSTGTTLINLAETFLNDQFSSIQITENRGANVTLNEANQASYSFKTISPLEYQGSYSMNQDGDSANFNLDLTQ